MKLPWSKKVESKIEESPIERVKCRPPLRPYIHTSYALPHWDLKKDSRRAFRAAAIDALTLRCSQRTGSRNLAVRQLIAKDLGLKAWRTPSQHAGERSLWINCELKEHQFVAITGVIQLSKNPKVSEMLIRMGAAGSNTLGVLNLDELYSILPIIKKLESFRADDELFSRFGRLEDIRMAAYFSEPYIFDQKQIIHISVASPEENKTGDRLMLSGFVVEPIGVTIS